MKKSSFAVIVLVLAAAIGIGYLFGPGKWFQGRLTPQANRLTPRPEISPENSKPSISLPAPVSEKPDLFLKELTLVSAKADSESYSFFAQVRIENKGGDIENATGAYGRCTVDLTPFGLGTAEHVIDLAVAKNAATLSMKKGEVIKLNFFPGTPNDPNVKPSTGEAKLQCVADYTKTIDDSDIYNNGKSFLVPFPPPSP